MTDRSPRLLVVDDHRLLAEGLVIGLAQHGYEAVVAPEVAPDTVLALCGNLQPDIVLLDLHLGEHGSSVDLIRPLSAQGVRIVTLTVETEPAALGACLAAGAAAIWHKTSSFDELCALLADLLAGQVPVLVEARREMIEAFETSRRRQATETARFDTLTPREEQVLGALMHGHNVTEIARTSYVSTRTVRSQVQSILAKLGVNSQLRAVVMAVDARWQPRQPPAAS